MEENKLSYDEEKMLALAVKANAIERNKKIEITIGDKKCRLRRISLWQDTLITNLDYDAMYYQQKIQDEKLSHRQIKRYNKKFRQVSAKKAAHYVLGKYLWLIPFVFAFTWRKIYNESEEVSATINSSQIVGGSDKDFYLANLGCSKYRLALSTKQVGESVKQMQERKESAESMLDEDALPKKVEGNK